MSATRWRIVLARGATVTLATVAALAISPCLAASPAPSATAGATAAAENRPPNLVILFADDLGYGDLSCYGSKRIRTPRLDRLAAEGMRMTSFYAQPVCGVSRAALMTGCYPIRVAEVGNRKVGHPVLHPREITLAEVLRGAGYATGLVGKWHLAGGRREAYPPERMPLEQGFDTFFGTPLHNGFTREVDPRSFKTQLMRQGEVIDDFVDADEMGQLTRRYTDEAKRFIRERRDRRFFLYLAYNMPHIPLGASPAFRGRSGRGLYADVVEELDASVGEVLDLLEELGLAERTLVLFTSDNGPWIEAHVTGAGGDDAYHGLADPLRGAKMMTWEGGLRVPCIARLAGRIPAGSVCDEVASTMDILPTFARLAGAALPADRAIDGRDLWPLLSGRPGARSPHEAFFYYAFVHLEAVRGGRWKLVLPRPARPPWTSWSARLIDEVKRPGLYDLEEDIAERRDVAALHPEVVARLMARVDRARDDLGDFDRIGRGARFFEPGPRRPESRRWIEAASRERDGGGPYPAGFAHTAAIAREPGVTRRDPSDVIEAGGLYHVWYSRVEKGPGVWRYPSGYSAELWHATSPDGRVWTERERALAKGERRAWDGHGVFTPNILVARGKYYLFYTAVAVGHGETTPTRIGVAIAERPEGPWRRFEGNPVLAPSDDPGRFDSMRVDDASLIVCGGKYWLYYKGRQTGHGPGETKMGLAIADRPTGPYRKHEAGALHPGHEVLVWPQGDGVASLATAAGPRRVYFAADGIHFEPRDPVADPPHAPGGFRPDRFREEKGRGLTWGIGHASLGGDLYLTRFDARWWTPPAPKRAARGGRPPAARR